jgi:hypothetical protein
MTLPPMPAWFPTFAREIGDAAAALTAAEISAVIDEVFRPQPVTEAPRRRRKPSLRRLIADAERAGKPLTSVTMPDGTTLHFHEPDPIEASNPWLADLRNRVTKQ